MENGEDSSTNYGCITYKNTSVDLEFVVGSRFKVVINVRDGFVNGEVWWGEDAYLDTKGPKGVIFINDVDFIIVKLGEFFYCGRIVYPSTC